MAKPWNEVGRYGGVGIDLVVAILLCAGAGHWLDQRYWKGHDYGMVAGFFLGLAVGIHSLVRASRRMQRDIERSEANDPEGSRWTVDETWLHKDDPDAPAREQGAGEHHDDDPHEPLN